LTIVSSITQSTVLQLPVATKGCWFLGIAAQQKPKEQQQQQ
jgi:hypothetical protein